MIVRVIRCVQNGETRAESFHAANGKGVVGDPVLISRFPFLYRGPNFLKQIVSAEFANRVFTIATLIKERCVLHPLALERGPRT